MDTRRLPERLAGGVDQRNIPESNRATDIVNMRVDTEGLGWAADRGWEPYFPANGFTKWDSDATLPAYSLHVFQSKGGSQTHALMERNGVLLHQHGVVGATSPFIKNEILDAGRHQPKPDDPGTQYVEHQDFIIIVNGVDPVLKFRGGKYCTLFGFPAKPTPPTVFSPDPMYYSSTGGSSRRNGGQTIALRLNALNSNGLGTATLTATEANSYFYRVAFVSDTGSISPLSEPVRASWNFAENGDTPGRYGVLLRDLPIGPNNTVGRIIYRTKNTRLVDEQGQTLYYYLATVQGNAGTDYMDVTPDAELVAPAPELTDAVVFPQTLRFIASWDGRTWATGGTGYERRIIYSDRNAPETFKAFSFFDVGNRSGGDITGLFAYYGALIVMRESAIEVITFAADGSDYRISVLSPDMGTTATNTPTLVPGVGLLFLNHAGVYAIKGNGDGGNLRLEPISGPVTKEYKRVTKSALPRATASWSPREREWWCHYPADGATRPTRGIVYHADTDQFSFRHATDTSGPGAFQFNALATLPSGYFLIAPQTVYAPPLLYNPSLQVWSATNDEGKVYNVSASLAGGFTINSIVDGPGVQSVWSSNWEDFGDDAMLKSVRYVLIEVLTEGHNDIALDYAQDWKEDYTSAGGQAAAVTLKYGGATEDRLYGPGGSTSDSVALIGTDRFTSERVTRIRWDVGGKNHQWFKFRISSQEKFTVLRYHIEYVTKQRMSLKQRAGR